MTPATRFANRFLMSSMWSRKADSFVVVLSFVCIFEPKKSV